MGFKISYISFFQNGSIFCYRFFFSVCFFFDVSSITTQSTLQLVAQLLKRMTQEYMLRHFFVVDIIVNHSGHFLSKQSSIRFCFVHVINNRIVAFQWTCATTHVIFAMTLFFKFNYYFLFFIQFFVAVYRDLLNLFMQRTKEFHVHFSLLQMALTSQLRSWFRRQEINYDLH